MFCLFKNKKILLIIAVVLLLIFLNSFWPTLCGSFFSKVTTPFQTGFNVGSQKIYNFFETLFSLTIKLKEKALENEYLKAQLDQELERGVELLMTRVIGREPQNLGQYILINKGLKRGVKAGVPVVDKAGCLVGKVSKVFSNTSQVLLITDPTSSINALIQESRASGIVKGEYGLGLLMDLIPQGEEISKNYIVITSGLGDQFPQGIFIGKVDRVVEQETEIFKKAWIKPAVDFSHLERVFVVLDY